MISLVYCGLALFWNASRTQRNLMAVLILSISVFVILTYGTVFVKKKNLTIMLSGLLIAGIGFNIYYQYSLEKDYLSEFAEQGEAMSKLEAGTDLAVLDAGDDSLYRYDQMDALSCENSSMHMGTNGTSYYFSVASESIGRFFDEMYLNTPWEQHYENLDSRTILDRLAAVKYFVVDKNENRYLPYGFTEVKGESQKEKKEYKAYRNNIELPLGYTYDSYIPRSEYEKMSVTEKQQALLQGVVMEDSFLPETEPVYNDKELSYRMIAGKGVKVKDGKITVTQENAILKLVFRGLSDSETYLVTENLNYDGLSPRELISDKKWEKMTPYEQNQVLYENNNWRYWKESQKASIKVSGNFPAKTIRIFTDKYNAYSGKHNFLCNTGYDKNNRTSIMLTFENTGVYTFDSIKVISQPVKELDTQTEKLKQETLEDVKLVTNGLEGKISVSEPKVLLIALPYSKGFKAYVDGKETELKEADTMYMALELEPGEHEIRLTYCTPYLPAGFCLTCIGILCYSVVVLKNRKKRTAAKVVKQ